MIGDAGEDVTQIGFRIEAVELGGFDERIVDGGMAANATALTCRPTAV